MSHWLRSALFSCFLIASVGARAQTPACDVLIRGMRHAERHRRQWGLGNPLNFYRNFWPTLQTRLAANLRRFERPLTPPQYYPELPSTPHTAEELQFVREEIFDKILAGSLEKDVAFDRSKAVHFYEPSRESLDRSPGAWVDLIRQYPDQSVATLLTWYLQKRSPQDLYELFSRRPEVLWLAVAEARLESPQVLAKALRHYRYRLGIAWGAQIGSSVAAMTLGTFFKFLFQYCGTSSAYSSPIIEHSCHLLLNNP